MVLADTSVWIDHFRRGNAALAAHLDGCMVLCHPCVIGELALGQLRDRRAVLTLLAELPAATVASHGEVLAWIETHRLAGRGIGFVDAHLLAAARLTPDAWLWTLDRRLAAVASELGLDAR